MPSHIYLCLSAFFRGSAAVHGPLISAPRLSSFFSPLRPRDERPEVSSDDTNAVPPPPATNRNKSLSEGRRRDLADDRRREFWADAFAPTVPRETCKTRRAFSTAVESWSLCNAIPGRIWPVF